MEKVLVSLSAVSGSGPVTFEARSPVTSSYDPTLADLGIASLTVQTSNQCPYYVSDECYLVTNTTVLHLAGATGTTSASSAFIGDAMLEPRKRLLSLFIN